MNLSETLKETASDIRSRGEDYFMKGRVIELNEYDTGKWKAVVEGSQPYTVDVVFAIVNEKQEEIQSMECSCPYDWSLVCKHEVAVLMAIEEVEAKKAFAQKTGLPQQLHNFSTFKSWLAGKEENLDRESLLDFIGEYGKWNAPFREAFQEWMRKREAQRR